MAGTSPRLPEQFYYQEPVDVDFHVNELAADQAGGLPPFGDDIAIPMPLDKIFYEHPRPEDRPHLAGGR